MQTLKYKKLHFRTEKGKREEECLRDNEWKENDQAKTE